MKKGLKYIARAVFIGGPLALVGIGMNGSSDRISAEKYLEDKGYKVVEYKGKPDFWTRQKNRAFCQDAFTVIGQNGKTENVVVAKFNGLFYKNTSIVFDQK